MPIFNWIRNTMGTAGTTAASNYWITDVGTAPALYNNAVSAWCGLANQTTTATTGIYAQQALMQQMMSQQTATSSMASALGYNDTVWMNQSTGEVWVDHRQYLALAQGRVEYYRLMQAQEQAQLQAQEQARLAMEQERTARYGELRKQALARSKELLLSHLTKEQRETFEKNNWFVVTGGKSKTRYRIRGNGYAGNIDVLAAGSKKNDTVIGRLCCHATSDIPLYDQLLGQKLHLQYNEERFLSIANRHAA